MTVGTEGKFTAGMGAELVAKINRAAMKAIGDIKTRRGWSESRYGSPVVTNSLCAQIARLTLINTELTEALKGLLARADAFRALFLTDEIDEGLSLEVDLIDLADLYSGLHLSSLDARAALAKALEQTPDHADGASAATVEKITQPE